MNKDINMGAWISIEEQLPPEKGEYLVTYHPCYWDNVQPELKVGLDSYRGGKNYSKYTWAKNKYQRVTHWMKLPEPAEKQ